MEEPRLADLLQQLKAGGGLSNAEESRANQLNIQTAQFHARIRELTLLQPANFQADIRACEAQITENTKAIDGIIKTAKAQIEASSRRADEAEEIEYETAPLAPAKKQTKEERKGFLENLTSRFSRSPENPTEEKISAAFTKLKSKVDKLNKIDDLKDSEELLDANQFIKSIQKNLKKLQTLRTQKETPGLKSKIRTLEQNTTELISLAEKSIREIESVSALLPLGSQPTQSISEQVSAARPKPKLKLPTFRSPFRSTEQYQPIGNINLEREAAEPLDPLLIMRTPSGQTILHVHFTGTPPTPAKMEADYNELMRFFSGLGYTFSVEGETFGNHYSLKLLGNRNTSIYINFEEKTKTITLFFAEDTSTNKNSVPDAAKAIEALCKKFNLNPTEYEIGKNGNSYREKIVAAFPGLAEKEIVAPPPPPIPTRGAPPVEEKKRSQATVHFDPATSDISYIELGGTFYSEDGEPLVGFIPGVPFDKEQQITIQVNYSPTSAPDFTNLVEHAKAEIVKLPKKTPTPFESPFVEDDTEDKTEEEPETKTGMFKPIKLDSSKHSVEQQARLLVNEAYRLHEAGYKKIRLLCYMNHHGDIIEPNQARVAKEIEKIIRTEDAFKKLDGIFAFRGITTTIAELKSGEIAPDLNARIENDRRKIKKTIEEGGVVLGWQTQQSTNDKPYDLTEGIPEGTDAPKQVSAKQIQDTQAFLQKMEREHPDTNPHTDVKSDIGHKDTGYNITHLIATHRDSINYYAGRIATGGLIVASGGYTLAADNKSFTREVDGKPHKITINSNGTMESDFIHADSGKLDAILANDFIIALRTYAVLYAKSGNSLAALPEGILTLRLNPRQLESTHAQNFDALDDKVHERLMKWVKNHPKEYPKELIAKFQYIKPDGTKMSLSENVTPAPTPKRTREASDGLSVKKKAKTEPTVVPKKVEPEKKVGAEDLTRFDDAKTVTSRSPRK
jgi:cell fate (sporulation/competence/biofilm development) regulator YmcA (YheA/YmcA/DUF963 family)